MNNYLALFFFFFFLLKLSFTAQTVGIMWLFPTSPQGCVKVCEKPIIKIKSHQVYLIATGYIGGDGCVWRGGGELERYPAPSTLSCTWSPHGAPKTERCKDCEKNKFQN